MIFSGRKSDISPDPAAVHSGHCFCMVHCHCKESAGCVWGAGLGEAGGQDTLPFRASWPTHLHIITLLVLIMRCLSLLATSAKSFSQLYNHLGPNYWGRICYSYTTPDKCLYSLVKKTSSEGVATTLESLFYCSESKYFIMRYNVNQPGAVLKLLLLFAVLQLAVVCI